MMPFTDFVKMEKNLKKIAEIHKKTLKRNETKQRRVNYPGISTAANVSS